MSSVPADSETLSKEFESLSLEVSASTNRHDNESETRDVLDQIAQPPPLQQVETGVDQNSGTSVGRVVEKGAEQGLDSSEETAEEQSEEIEVEEAVRLPSVKRTGRMFDPIMLRHKDEKVFLIVSAHLRFVVIDLLFTLCSHILNDLSD